MNYRLTTYKLELKFVPQTDTRKLTSNIIKRTMTTLSSDRKIHKNNVKCVRLWFTFEGNKDPLAVNFAVVISSVFADAGSFDYAFIFFIFYLQRVKKTEQDNRHALYFQQ